jgi:hypothetical protein
VVCRFRAGGLRGGGMVQFVGAGDAELIQRPVPDRLQISVYPLMPTDELTSDTARTRMATRTLIWQLTRASPPATVLFIEVEASRGGARRKQPTRGTLATCRLIARPKLCCSVKQDVSTAHPLRSIQQIHLNMTQAPRPCRSAHRLASDLDQQTDHFALFSTQGWANNLLNPRIERDRGCR